MTKYLLVIFAIQFAYALNIPKTVQVSEPITFSDDLDFQNMNLAISRQLKSFEKLNLTMKIKFGNRTITRNELKLGLLEFKTLLLAYKTCKKAGKEDCMAKFSLSVNSKFDIFRPSPLKWEKGFKENKSFFTAYYSPEFEGSFTKTDRFKYPIYKKPKNAKLASLSRTDIDFKNKLSGRGLEAIYVDSNYYDLWLFHVEGGGRVNVKQTDGSFKYYYLSYDGHNSQPFNMLSKYMLANKMITPENRSVLAQKSYLARHPEDIQKVMASSQSYIFFKITKHEPLGVRNMPLTENRSLATDKRRYKVYGILNFIESKKAVKLSDENLKLVDYSRFYISQDTGGGIKGNARSDLYFGYGQSAALSANSVATLGNQYFLVLKAKN